MLDTFKRDDIVSGEDVKVGDYDAYIAKVDLGKGNLKASMIAVVFKDGGVYLFKGEAGEGGDAAQFEADFRATVQSFRPMQPGDLKVANNQRIKVIEGQARRYLCVAGSQVFAQEQSGRDAATAERRPSARRTARGQSDQDRPVVVGNGLEQVDRPHGLFGIDVGGALARWRVQSARDRPGNTRTGRSVGRAKPVRPFADRSSTSRRRTAAGASLPAHRRARPS